MRLETWREQGAANEDGDAPVNLFSSEIFFFKKKLRKSSRISQKKLNPEFFFQKKGHAAHVPEYTLS